MGSPSDRRGFLRALATLPLIGGGVTVVGRPTGAAVPVTPDLLDSYDAWLHFERSALRWERFGPNAPLGDRRPYGPEIVLANRSTGKMFDYVLSDNPGGHFHDWRGTGPKASARAAVVLAAVGCDWRSA